MLNEIKLIGEQKRVGGLNLNGYFLIKGVAGSGKTTIALYRLHRILESQKQAKHQYENGKFIQDNKVKVGIFTYHKVLASYIKDLTSKLLGSNNVEITTFHKWSRNFTHTHTHVMTKIGKIEPLKI